MGAGSEEYRRNVEFNDSVLRDFDGYTTYVVLEAPDGSSFQVRGEVAYKPDNQTCITTKEGEVYCLQDYPLVQFP